MIVLGLGVVGVWKKGRRRFKFVAVSRDGVGNQVVLSRRRRS